MPALACFDQAIAALPPAFAFSLAGESSLPGLSPLLENGFSGQDLPEKDFSDEVTNPNIGGLWSPELSASLYRINGWGAPYFSINGSGNLSVRPHGLETLLFEEIDLMKVVKKAVDSRSNGGLGLQLPLIVRLPDVLKHRIDSLQSAFDSAIRSQSYDSHYQGVYPVKCNQDRSIVEDIVAFGRSHRFGLEAGSKPELLLAMSALCKGSPESYLICNGYKDEEYISLALMARKMGLDTVIVLEQEEEVDLVIEISKKLSVRPVIGIRAKLRTKHSGHFGSTSGEKGKFGLTTLEILGVVRKLRGVAMLDCLQLLHFHIGSQIPSVSLLGDGVGEAAQIYCELVRLGAGMRVIDIGGGLGVDYDGSKSSASDMSIGYTLEEYAATVVQAVRYVCDQKFVKHPVICSESGRALVSHHSVLVFEATAAREVATPGLDLSYLTLGLSDDARTEYGNLMGAAMKGEYELCLVHAEQLKQRCVEEFKLGSFALEQLAAVDMLCDLLSHASQQADSVRTYHVNLSVFSSIPDFWAIEQLFPIMPIHRLDQRPSINAILSDLTCDSDGKVTKFIGGATSLPLHESRPGEPYYLGMFLGGAYQEALGGLHNLLGSASVVRVVGSDGGGQAFAVTGAVPGQSCADVLRAMRHEPDSMFEALKCRAEDCFMGESVARTLAWSFNAMPYLRHGATTAAGDEHEWGGYDYY
ncbi:hypothetical protein AMTRI_Chr09g40260 [Amborella trichopoda]|uniref:Arginine decarboxylase n=1 Tax=Amborella trichopoda TaxID=13333 RepID=U5D1L6_AMBTC|nr:arginine decarboxylase [Amborella trichopoda]ERN16324.1 hypothetical protein AMTR_s00182p00026140 [Amborella trichopoda]|eukprot:XP_006854857.1 arginine decarboxylase [Amborella trichopoda]